jgi:hypothetical protein
MSQAEGVTVDRESALRRAQKKKGGFVWLARVPFIVTAIFGMALILGLKHRGIPQAYVTGVAVLCLLAYAFFVWRVPKFRIREDQLGDNCYYLGFLYTLTSLAYALWVFATRPDDKLQVVEIVGSFGLALASTIVGILLRVFINQQRRDVVENEQEARRALTEAVSDLRSQLADASVTMDVFQRETKQAIRDTMAAQVEATNAALQQSIEKMGGSTKAVLEHINEAFTEFLDHSRTMNENSAATVKAIQKLVKRIDGIEAPADLLTRRLEPALDAAVMVAEALRKRIEVDEAAMDAALGRSGKIEAGFDQAAAAFEGTITVLRRSADEASRSAAAVGSVTDSLTRLSNASAESVERQLAISRSLSASLDSAIDALRAHNEGMAKELARARSMANETGDAMAEMADGVARKVIEMRRHSYDQAPERALENGS